LLHQSEAVIFHHYPSFNNGQPMISQHQRDNNEGQRRDDGEPPKVNQTSQTWANIGVEGPNSPKGCGMQRLMGHQRKPVESI
jgi:hypothetical protein